MMGTYIGMYIYPYIGYVCMYGCMYVAYKAGAGDVHIHSEEKI